MEVLFDNNRSFFLTCWNCLCTIGLEELTLTVHKYGCSFSFFICILDWLLLLVLGRSHMGNDSLHAYTYVKTSSRNPSFSLCFKPRTHPTYKLNRNLLVAFVSINSIGRGTLFNQWMNYDRGADWINSFTRTGHSPQLISTTFLHGAVRSISTPSQSFLSMNHRET